MAPRRIAVLSGGVGGARFLHGLIRVVPGADVTVIGNVGDDFEPYGLHVSPDLDTILYTLSGAIDDERGWGVTGDSARALERARELGDEAWFWLGDLDLGLHLARAAMLREGRRLSEATAVLATASGLDVALLPATDDRLRTMLSTDAGELDFQTYYVRRRHADAVHSIRFDGAENALPAAGVVEAIEGAEVVLIAPSNPLVSIGPIMAVPGIQEAIEVRRGPTVAVSPIVGGDAVRGPAADMLDSLGHGRSAAGVAAIYAGLCSAFVLDRRDDELVPTIENLGLRTLVTETLMTGHEQRRALAAAALEAAGSVEPAR